MPFSARSGVAAVLAVFVVVAALVGTLASVGSAAPAAAKGSANLCNITGFPGGKPGQGSSAFARASGTAGAAGAIAHGSGIPKKLAVFVLEKAVGVNLERWALTGMGNLLRMMKLDFIAPDSPEQKVLGQLQAINARLAEMEGRIERVGESVNSLTAERRGKDLDDEIKGICLIADRQMFYYRHLHDATETGKELGEALKRADPSLPPGTDPEVSSLRREAQKEMDFFINNYDPAKSAEQIGTLRTALVAPKRSDALSPSTSTVLKTFGGVIIAGNRFLRSEHSEALRALYDDVLEIRALATWMEAEFYRTQDLLKKEARVWDSFVEDDRDGAAGLPPTIPPGVVIDLGDEPRSSTNDKPMWFAPTNKDLGWLPTFDIGRHVFSIDEVDLEISRLNERQNLHSGWHAPHKQEFLALISNGCRANSHPHKQEETLVGCKNAVPGGANIAAYLQKINPDKTWQELFCQSSVNWECPRGAGPQGIRQGPHAFIWTSDRHIQQLSCVWEGVRVTVPTRTYAGYHTLGPVKHEVFPHFPGKINGDCIAYLRSLIGDPNTGAGRNHLFEGVLLATRYTTDVDTNRTDHLDYMAQPVR